MRIEERGAVLSSAKVARLADNAPSVMNAVKFVYRSRKRALPFQLPLDLSPPSYGNVAKSTPKQFDPVLIARNAIIWNGRFTSICRLLR